MPYRPFNADAMGKHFPLGDSITGSPHSVTVSLPTAADVIGYEEKDPRVLQAMESGYPRFIIHPMIRRWRAEVWRDLGWGERAGFGLATEQAVREWTEFVGEVAKGADVAEVDGAWWVCLPRGAGQDAVRRARAFLVHTGCGVSSRQAEAALVARGLEEPYAEARLEAPAMVADAKVRGYLSVLYGAEVEDIYLCRSGMNAFYAGFRALRAVAAKEGRDLWIQLGWLYVDTTRLLEEYSPRYQQPEKVLRVDSLDALEALMRERGRRVAGIVTEAPTNPLVQTPDLPWLRALADQYGAALVLDPSLASPVNMHLFPYADLHVNSLTKYASPDGDVMIGVLAVNPSSRFYEGVSALVDRHRCAPFWADLQRLAFEIDRFEDTVEQVNANTREVVAWLEKQPEVKAVYWAGQAACVEHFERLGRDGRAPGPGAIISFVLHTPWQDFYDRLAMPKTPSFGASFSMICPFIYLAHYDLVSDPQGRHELDRAGLAPDLLRLSVGTEPVEEIIKVLEKALRTR
ncbi:MAG: PLP-dependent transferase [Verrucomicrobiota bacterium JB022]|nr:PLP-dependent transferase [Verrucomicrobiota bacterium JB022]